MFLLGPLVLGHSLKGLTSLASLLLSQSLASLKVGRSPGSNRIRNQLEHAYTVPNVSDIEVFYDVVTGAVAVLQFAILQAFDTEVNFIVPGKGTLSINYSHKDCTGKAEWGPEDNKLRLECHSSDREALIYLLRVIFFIGQLDVFASRRYVEDRLGLGAQ
ncbi:MAG: hypothetical protein GY722_07995 [bacterium]|nr:hypothetical protein [bacterium]